MTELRKVQGYCPICRGDTLVLAIGGHITCGRLTCPRPTAVDELLEDHEIEHVVSIGDSAFMVRHPLRERLDDELMVCGLHKWIATRSGPPAAVGRYRVEWRGDPDTALWSYLGDIELEEAT